MSLRGSIDEQWLPATVCKIVLFSNYISGIADLTHLPAELTILSLGCNDFTADPMEGHLFVVGQDQYPSMGRFRKPPLVAMGDPGSSWCRDERTSTHSLWIKVRGEIIPHE
ncbi:hypothetical protein XU18_1416 [Perkinsela sp. CCAP 1560/4]|nr:hypothetical protein XU18_1416 [Perkinsela sp. CCAP 1560/4]|eukprot:KNH07984.1 hypothetical protein XU18_1416 [Perkinsela sp. CCAP 1560/4]